MPSNVPSTKYHLDDNRPLVCLACWDKDTQAAIVAPAHFNLGLTWRAARDVKSARLIGKAGLEVADFVSKSLAPEPQVLLRFGLQLLRKRKCLRM